MDRNLEKKLYGGKRTINDLNHSYADEGMTSKMIHLDRAFSLKDTAKIFFKHKPYANDIGEVKREISASKR